MAAYTHFRYIAYQVPTVATTQTGNIYGINPGKVSNPPDLKGNFKGLGDDAKTRVQRLIAVMIEAKRVIIFDDEQTLKIFMAPEFYFRPESNDVSYTTSQYFAIRDVLEETISKDTRFDDWLIIPGTIMWAWNKDGTVSGGGGVTVYHNTAICINGKNKMKHYIEKAKETSQDGLPLKSNYLSVYNSPIENDLFKKTPSQVWTKYMTQVNNDRHVFDISGIQFGLDICFDHYRYVTKSVIVYDHTKFVQLHLLTAAGRTIMKDAVAAIKGGYILRTDGIQLPMVNCKRIERYISKSDVGRNSEHEEAGPGSNLKSEAMLSDDLCPFEIDLRDMPSLYIPPPDGGKGFWKNHPQKINIYGKRRIP